MKFKGPANHSPADGAKVRYHVGIYMSVGIGGTSSCGGEHGNTG